MENITIAKHGGKSGLYFQFKADSRFKEHLPQDGVVLLPDQNLDRVLDDIVKRQGVSRKLIVRAGHACDTRGLVDVLDTKVVNSVNDVDRAVSAIRAQASSNRVMKYYEYETGGRGADLIGGINILIQPFVSGEFLVQMIAHPHVKGLYVVERMPIQANGRYFLPFVTYIDHTSNSRSIDGTSFNDSLNFKDKKLVELYEKVRYKLQELGVIDEKDALHLEIGERQAGKEKKVIHTLFQFRYFKRHQVRANFDVKHPNCPKFLNFGVTPLGGIRFMLSEISNYQNDGDVSSGLEAGHSYAGSSVTNKRPDISIKPVNMRVYVAENASACPLDHGHLAFMQRTPFSAVHQRNLESGQYKLTSNGIDARLEAIK